MEDMEEKFVCDFLVNILGDWRVDWNVTRQQTRCNVNRIEFDNVRLYLMGNSSMASRTVLMKTWCSTDDPWSMHRKITPRELSRTPRLLF